MFLYSLSIYNILKLYNILELSCKTSMVPALHSNMFNGSGKVVIYYFINMYLRCHVAFNGASLTQQYVRRFWIDGNYIYKILTMS